MPKRARTRSTYRQQEPLLEPKFHPPRLRAPLVERERLLARLDAVREQKLTLICAPAGSGKTTAISQWLASSGVRGQELPVAWVALESSDNDPLRFWRYVITACQVLRAEVGQAALAQITARLPPLAMPSLEMLLTLLLNDLARLPESGLLILEDYHLISDARIHETLLFFLEHLPVQLHLVILSRSTPPLPLARWRARGELCEIQAVDLRFSSEEMVSFLRQILPDFPVGLLSEACNRLEARLEGWAAGLRLLALALQGNSQQESIARTIATFAGEQRSLQEYFVSEVLNAQSEHLQHFLLRTSVLSRLTGALCDTVVDREDSARLLEEIERTGLFLEALDPSGEWYRYHALFAEAMQAEARMRLGDDALRELSRKASRWYERQDMFAEAVEAAFQAQDMERAATLIEDILGKVRHFILGPQVFEETNGFHNLRRWLEQLPSELFRGRPLLSLGYATALLFVFVVDQQPPVQVQATDTEEHYPSYASFLLQIESALQAAAEEFRARGDMPRFGSVLTFHALIAREQGRISAAVAYASEARKLLKEDDDEWRNMGLNVIGMGKLIDGQLEEARDLFLELCALCEMLGNRAILRANTALLNIVYYEQGKLHQTDTFFRQMLAEARKENDYDYIAHASLLLAWHAYEWNNLADAEQRARETLEHGRKLGNEEFQVLATLLLARIEHARGETRQAQQRCTRLLAHLPANSPLRYRLCREIHLAQARFALTLDDFAAVERWQANTPPDQELPLSLRVREELLAARWLLAQGRGVETLDSLARLLAEAQRQGRMRSAFEIQAVLLLAQQSCGQSQATSEALHTLLAQAHTEGYVRLFLDEGETMHTLLRVAIPHLRGRSLVVYAQTILSAASAERESQSGETVPAYTLLVEPLSPQEQRVLRLLMAGHSNPEMAHALVVSVNTIKVHIRNIYKKLSVNNRLEACEAARSLGFR